MISTIFSVLGLLMWLFGIVMGIVFLFCGKNVIENIMASIGVIFMTGLLGAFVSIHGLTEPIKDKVITYEIPTSIIKTNDVTIVNHIIKGKVVMSSQVFKEASYYNSTNIMIMVRRGRNFYNVEVGPYYKVIDKTCTE